MTGEDFLSRWSRLKRRAEQAKPESPEPPAAAAPDATIPELPPLDSLTAVSDFKPFLQAGVPDSLKAAALRRLWSIDPEIRDFVGPARDYGWDWNTPGGVPGSGPLPSAEQIAKLVEQIFGVPEDLRTKDVPTAQAAAKPAPQAPPDPGTAQLRSVSDVLPSELKSQELGHTRDSPEQQKEPARSSKQRHGSATPR